MTICAVILIGSVFGCAFAAQSETVDRVRITINAPSDVENVIAPRRHFKVSGELEGAIPDDAVMRVSVIDKTGNEVRFVYADEKGTDSLSRETYKGAFHVFSDVPFEDIAYTAPEFVVDDVRFPEASFHDATIKCVYTDETFYALITSATDTAHGLYEDDHFHLTDQNGSPYDALPEGDYLVRVTLNTADGKLIGEAEKNFVIGKTNGTIIHEITDPTVISKGGKDILFDWAVENNFTVLTDLLPGFFGELYAMSALPMSVECETAEYIEGPIKVLLYNNTEDSASCFLEIAKYLMLKHNTQNPDIAEYYVFDIGEPMIGDVKANIISLEDEKIHITRVDTVSKEAEDGIWIETEEQLIDSDMDSSDGWSVKAGGRFAVAGVVQPFQLEDGEITENPDIYGYYDYANGPAELIYTFTSKEVPQSVVTCVEKMGVNRRADRNAAQDADSVYEFYNVFDTDLLGNGTDYTVNVRLLDRKGTEIAGWRTGFDIHVIRD